MARAPRIRQITVIDFGTGYNMVQVFDSASDGVPSKYLEMDADADDAYNRLIDAIDGLPT